MGQLRCAVVGLGLIGGSLAWDLTTAGHYVVGISRNPATCEQAVTQGLVTKASVHLEDLRGEALDVVVVCTPIPDVLPTIRALAAILLPRVTITDVTSVKGDLVIQATTLWPEFIGGHPMAGTTQQGIAAAQRGLFRGATYALTPLPATSALGLARLTQLIEVLGAERLICDPMAHDQAVAAISHVPVWVSAALIAVAAAGGELPRHLASSGFRDTSRVGGGNPALGVGMAQANQQAIVAGLVRYQAQLQQIQDWIVSEQWSELETFLQQTRTLRTEFRGIP